MSTTYCPAGDGCNYCTCYGGQWGCTDIFCGDGGSLCPPSPPAGGSMCGDPGLTCGSQNWGYCSPECTCTSNGFWSCLYPPCPPPPPACPPTPPPQGSACYPSGTTCGPANFGGYCSPTCTCDNGAWYCSYPPCPPPPPCPPTQPNEYSQCYDVGQSCAYYYGCSSAYCTCQSPGAWFCSIGDCADAGVYDASPIWDN
jgi:hypothetical protein